MDYVTARPDEPEALGEEAMDRERGASLVEYGLLLALIAIVCLVAITTLGGNLSGSFDSSAESLFP